MNPNKIIYTAALGNAAVNAALNGIITFFTFKSFVKVPFSLDSISNKEITVFGTILPTVLQLSFILGIITYFRFKKTAMEKNLAEPATINKPIFPDMIKFIFGKTITAFGFMMIISVLWQRFFGTLYTSNLIATIIIATASGLTALYIGVSVSKEIIRQK